MSDDATAAAGEPEPVVSETSPRGKWRWARRALALVVAVLAALIVSIFTIDLGRFPQLKQLAEAQASRFLDRPMHIGRIGAELRPGHFTLDDIVIEGRQPGDRPFFQAKRLFVYVPWWTMLRGQIIAEVRLTGWRMVVESWADRVHNVPRLTSRNPSSGPSRFNKKTVNFVYADDGEFIFEDHGTPWSVVARNLRFDLVHSAALGQYVGRAQFSDGTVQIQGFQPMRTDMTTRFALDGPRVTLQHIDLVTDGSSSHVNGLVDFSKGMIDHTYNFNSTVDFPRMREIFFAKEPWRLAGQGQFNGVFRLFREGGRELSGEFSAERAAVDRLEFGHLHGSLLWTQKLFAVTHADADVLGGTTRFAYSLAPLGSPTGATATFTADYADVNLRRLDALVDLQSLGLLGRADGSLAMQWANGRFTQTRAGRGHTIVTAPPGVAIAPRGLPAAPLPVAAEPQPFAPLRPMVDLPVAADVHYEIDPAGMTFEESTAATAHTFVAFHGRMATAGDSAFPFHVTSHDWQESDRLLAAIMTAVSGQTRAVEVGGRGTFDGAMTGTFSSPRIAGKFAGEAMRVWDVTWGRAAGDIVIHNGYLDLSNSLIGDGPDQTIRADGRYALGFRRDDAEEINAHVQLANWPLVDLRHAFGLDDWNMEGLIGRTDLQLRGRYRNMFGTGQVRLDRGRAWGETFEAATADVELEGTGLRLSRLELKKSVGVVRGAARVGWDGTYAFSADGEGIPVEDLDLVRPKPTSGPVSSPTWLERAPLSGVLTFRASGAGEFDRPAYRLRAQVPDLFAGDEGIGPVDATIAVSDGTLMIESLSAASSRLQVVGKGTIALDTRSTADLQFRFQQTAIHPYLKFVLPEVSPYTRAVVSGQLVVRGPLSQPQQLTMAADIDEAVLTLFDYDLQNDGPIDLKLDQQVFTLGQVRLRGSDTRLALHGNVNFDERRLDLSTEGDASLKILQLFFRGITAEGSATLNASLKGSLDDPRLTGEAALTGGRLRPLASPHSLEAMNGHIRFDGRSISFADLSGRIGKGEVDFGGDILLDGYKLSEYNVTATGRSMELRYPVGFRSTVNMNLRLDGPMTAPRLTGDVDVLRTVYVGAPQTDSALAALAAGGTVGGAVSATEPLADEDALPVVLDIDVRAPDRMTLIDRSDGTAKIEGTADLHVGGTMARPAITGGVEILGGEVLFSGNRYIVGAGSIAFVNPYSLDPVFDIAATTRPRVAGQTYTIDLRVSGTFGSFTPTLTSDPFLPEIDILTLLVGATPDVSTAEQRALRSPQEAQTRLIQTLAAQLIASPISSRVGSVVAKTFPIIDTVQITPLLENTEALRQVNPTARVTLGKRISNRVYLTYSRTVTTQDEIVLLEYDQSDRVSWVLSRNEDRTYALDFRIRFVF